MLLHNGLFIVWLGQTAIDVHMDVLACYSSCALEIPTCCPSDLLLQEKKNIFSLWEMIESMFHADLESLAYL